MTRYRVTFYRDGAAKDSFDYDTTNSIIAYNNAVTTMNSQGKAIPEEYRIINLDRSPPSDDIPIAEA